MTFLKGFEQSTLPSRTMTYNNLYFATMKDLLVIHERESPKCPTGLINCHTILRIDYAASKNIRFWRMFSEWL